MRLPGSRRRDSRSRPAGQDGVAVLALSRRTLDALDSAASETLALPLEPLPADDAAFARLLAACDRAAEQVAGTPSTHADLTLPADLLPVVVRLLPVVAGLVGSEELLLRTGHSPYGYEQAQVELLGAVQEAARP